jgi:N-acetylneuraminic acid mutarotase
MKAPFCMLMILLYFPVFPANSQVEWKTCANRIISGPCKAVTCKGKIYVASTNAGNRMVMEEYDPVSDTWTLKKAISRTINGGEFCAAATEAGIFFMGGWTDTSLLKIGKGISLVNMEKYDVEKDTFINLDNMPIGLDCAAAVSVNNMIYIMGGRAKDTDPLSDKMYMYDPAKAVWTEKHASSHGRAEAYGVNMDGKIYLFGGYRNNPVNNELMIDNKMDVYDPSTDSWTLGDADLVEAEKNPLGMGAIQHNLYFLVMAKDSEEVYSYDPILRSTVKLAGRPDLTWLMGTVSLNDAIYLIGGIKGDFPYGERQSLTVLLRLAN